eukprot:scaffold1314_cov393-Prasinococcus_capsulatus_cf.AAC.13
MPAEPLRIHPSVPQKPWPLPLAPLPPTPLKFAAVVPSNGRLGSRDAHSIHSNPGLRYAGTALNKAEFAATPICGLPDNHLYRGECILQRAARVTRHAP